MRITPDARSSFDQYASYDMVNLRQLSSNFATASVAAGAAAEVEAKIVILKRIQDQGYPEEILLRDEMISVKKAIREYEKIKKEIDRLLSTYGKGYHADH